MCVCVYVTTKCGFYRNLLLRNAFEGTLKYFAPLMFAAHCTLDVHSPKIVFNETFKATGIKVIPYVFSTSFLTFMHW